MHDSNTQIPSLAAGHKKRDNVYPTWMGRQGDQEDLIGGMGRTKRVQSSCLLFPVSSISLGIQTSTVFVISMTHASAAILCLYISRVLDSRVVRRGTVTIIHTTSLNFYTGPTYNSNCFIDACH